MVKKPTCEELEQRLRELEKKQDEYKIIEKNLLIEKQFSDSAINSLPGIFYLYDKKGRLYRWNKNLEKVSEYSFEEISKMTLYDFFVQEDKKVAADTIREVFQKGKSSVELDVLSKSGKKTPYYLTGERTNIGKASYLIGMGIDITERKQAEEQQRASAELYHIMTSTSMDGFVIVDAPGRILDVNEAYSRMIGYSRDELLNMFVSDIEVIHNPDEIQEQHKKTIVYGSNRFESRHRSKDGRIIDVEISMTFFPQSRNILIFIRDITERVQSEEALLEGAEHLRIITNTSMDGFVVTDSGGKFLDVNDAFCQIEGYSRDELLKMSVADVEIIDTPDEIHERFKKATETGSDRFETCHRRKDGRIIDVEVSMTSIQRKGLHLNFVRDITERKRAEAKIRESEEKYRLLFDTTEVLLSVYNREGVCQLINRRVAALFGGEPEDFIGKSILELHPKDGGDYLRSFHEAIDSGVVLEREDEVVFSQGSRWLLTRLQPLPDEQGVFSTVQIISQDITERKQAEEVLRDSAEYLGIITNTSMDGFVVTDSGGKFLDVNDAFCQIEGYSRDELLKMSVADVEIIDTPDEIHERFKKATETGSDRFETCHRRKDGRIIDVEVSMTSIQRKGLHLNFVRDITERKRAEAKIRENEEKYRLLFETNEVLLTVCDRRGVCQLMNKRVAALHGGEPKDFIGKSFKELHPKSGGEYIRDIQETIDLGISREYEDEIEFFQGKRWLLTRMQPVPDAKGVFRTVQIISQDITERKQAEDALRVSQERLSLVIEGSNDGFWDWNVATGQAYFSPRYYTMLGYAPDEFPATYENWRSLIHPEDIAAAEETLMQHFEEILPIYAAELRLKTRSGDYRWVLTRGKVVERDAEGKVVRMSGTHSDITERKKAEEAFRLEKHFSDTLIDSMPGIFSLFDVQGRFVRWNKRLESITGYFAEEIGQMKPTDFFVGEEKDYISRKFQEVFTKGETEAEAGLMTKGGRTIPHYFTGCGLSSAGNRMSWELA